MRILSLIIFVAETQGSHFRAVSYDIIQGKDDFLQISRTMAWRQNKGGYDPECTDVHVSNKMISESEGREFCRLVSGRVKIVGDMSIFGPYSKI